MVQNSPFGVSSKEKNRNGAVQSWMIQDSAGKMLVSAREACERFMYGDPEMWRLNGNRNLFVLKRGF
jgi:hypothetical protein